MKFFHFLLFLSILVLLCPPALASSYMKKQNCAKKVTIYIDDCESSGHQGCEWPYPPPPPGCDGTCLASCISGCNAMAACISTCATKCGC